MNNKQSYPIIAREGWLFIAIGIIVSIITFFISTWISLFVTLVTIFMVQFFRDPKRNTPNNPNIIFSPADGKVICIEKTIDPYQNVEATKISIFMNVFNIHSNKSPANGVIEQVTYIPGKFLNADFDKASTENERNAIVLKLANQDKITFVQIAGLIARRILCYVKVHDRLSSGERYGFIKFGSRVDVYLPLNYKIAVKINQKITGGLDPIAHII